MQTTILSLPVNFTYQPSPITDRHAPRQHKQAVTASTITTITVLHFVILQQPSLSSVYQPDSVAAGHLVIGVDKVHVYQPRPHSEPRFKLLCAVLPSSKASQSLSYPLLEGACTCFYSLIPQNPDLPFPTGHRIPPTLSRHQRETWT